MKPCRGGAARRRNGLRHHLPLIVSSKQLARLNGGVKMLLRSKRTRTQEGFVEGGGPLDHALQGESRFQRLASGGP